MECIQYFVHDKMSCNFIVSILGYDNIIHNIHNS